MILRVHQSLAPHERLRLILICHLVTAPKKIPAPEKTPAPKPTKKTLPQINIRPTQKLDIFVFGEGTAGELGLGGVKYDGNKKPIDVARPRINYRLSAKDIGVVQIAVGGMHCAALTHDNKILTWGVNDTGALGRRTGAAKTKEIASKDSDSDSDSEDDDDDEYLNPTESEPREVNPKYFPEGTQFAFLAASDSATFAVTTDGSVYGWGTFRVSSFKDLSIIFPHTNDSRAMTVTWASGRRKHTTHSKMKNMKKKVKRHARRD
jgi:regulator of chromosome condensation